VKSKTIDSQQSLSSNDFKTQKLLTNKIIYNSPTSQKNKQIHPFAQKVQIKIPN
jgi:hypothetical protein